MSNLAQAAEAIAEISERAYDQAAHDITKSKSTEKHTHEASSSFSAVTGDDIARATSSGPSERLPVQPDEGLTVREASETIARISNETPAQPKTEPEPAPAPVEVPLVEMPLAVDDIHEKEIQLGVIQSQLVAEQESIDWDLLARQDPDLFRSRVAALKQAKENLEGHYSQLNLVKRQRASEDQQARTVAIQRQIANRDAQMVAAFPELGTEEGMDGFANYLKTEEGRGDGEIKVAYNSYSFALAADAANRYRAYRQKQSQTRPTNRPKLKVRAKNAPRVSDLEQRVAQRMEKENVRPNSMQAHTIRISEISKS